MRLLKKREISIELPPKHLNSRTDLALLPFSFTSQINIYMAFLLLLNCGKFKFCFVFGGGSTHPTSTISLVTSARVHEGERFVISSRVYQAG